MRPRFLAAIGVCVLVTQTAFVDLCWSNSVTFQIDPAHDGSVNFSKGFAPPLRLKWIRDLQEGQVSYPVTGNGLVFVTAARPDQYYGSYLFALNQHTGETVWEKPIAGTYWFSAAAYDNGRVFVVNQNGVVQAFTGDANGTLLWSYQLGGQYGAHVSAAPTAFAGRLYVTGALDGVVMYALKEDTGALLWQTDAVNGSPWSSPAVGDRGIYLSYPCLDLKYAPVTGKLIWAAYAICTGGGGYTPTYFQNRLYTRDDDIGDYILDSGTGQPLGKRTITSTPVFWRDSAGTDFEIALRIPKTGSYGALVCFDIGTGKIVWTFHGDRKLTSSPVVINDMVAVGSATGNLFLVDAARGTQLWTANVGKPIPFSWNPRIAVNWTGFGVADRMLLVPASNLLAAYVPAQ